MNNDGFSENMAPLKSYKFKKIDSGFNGEYLPLCAKVSKQRNKFLASFKKIFC